MRSVEEEAAPELQRAISGDLMDEDEMDRVMDEAAEDAIYRVSVKLTENTSAVPKASETFTE